ncbi:MAG: DEAD/DEAH box helicase [Spirochaetota bacterium]|nr:DEAD/DEAH box helicase [Spirochaetota bacterium]
MKFTELNLNEKLQHGIDDAGFVKCMPVQEITFTHTFMGKDVYVQSQTGTGKTAAFLISIFYLMLQNEPNKRQKALVIAPTRELADQIGREAEVIGRHTGVKCGTFYGGVGYNRQEKLLRDGVDIIIGTPGRLIDFSKSGKLDLKKIGILVIDEADRLFDMGFLPDIRKMLKKLPSKSHRQSMLYSATLDHRVKKIASEYMNDAEEVEIEPDQITVESVSQKLYHVGREEKMNLLLGILKTEQPRNAIVFTNTKQKAVEVAKRLKHNGFNCQYIIGDLPQKKRLQIIDQLKSDKIPYLIATDVASRGLHIDDLEMVINYDLPENSESYVHRIGRTARVGKSGKAISLVCEKCVYNLEAIESYTKMKIPVEWAEDNLFEEDKVASMNFSMSNNIDGRQKRKTNNKRKNNQRRTSSNSKDKHIPVQGKRPIIKVERPKVVKDSKVKVCNAIKPINVEKQSRPSRNVSIDERLEYYSKKYGEKFIVINDRVDMKKKKNRNFSIKGISSILKKRKKTS